MQSIRNKKCKVGVPTLIKAKESISILNLLYLAKLYKKFFE